MTRQITTVAELDALPIGSVIREPDHYYPDGTFGYWGNTMPREEEGWLFDNCCDRHCPSAEVDLPATVLYEPGKHPRPLPDRDQIADLLRGYTSKATQAADAVIALLEREPA